ncbi:MAG: hypothetical protein QXI19_07625, partial [Candidatus Caldarchaeum sp.]
MATPLPTTPIIRPKTPVVDRDMSPEEIQQRIALAKDYVLNLYREGPGGAVVSEYPGVPLSIVVKKVKDPSWVDPHSPRQCGLYSSPPTGTDYIDQFRNRFCLQGLEISILGHNTIGWWENASGIDWFEDFYGFRILEVPLELAAKAVVGSIITALVSPIPRVRDYVRRLATAFAISPLGEYFSDPLLLVRFEYSKDGRTLLKIFLLKFRHSDEYYVHLFWGDYYIGKIDKDTPISDTVPLYAIYSPPWRSWGSARYTIRHGIMGASKFMEAFGETAKAQKLSSFAQSHGYTIDIYDPMWNKKNEDFDYIFRLAAWHDADLGLDHASNAHSWGFAPYRYAYESKVNTTGNWAVGLISDLSLGPAKKYIFPAIALGLAALLVRTFGLLPVVALGLATKVNFYLSHINLRDFIFNLDTRSFFVSFLGYQSYARALQALNVLLQKGPDYKYPDPRATYIDHTGKIYRGSSAMVTPREVARTFEAEWNGWGYHAWVAPGIGGAILGKDPRVSVAYYTCPIAILLTVLGYKYGDPYARTWADKIFRHALCEAQWGVHWNGSQLE